jgi:hypothetical protein
VTLLSQTAAARPELRRFALPARRLTPWVASWLQVGPLAFVLIVLFALPTVLFVVVSFWDYDRTGIYPAFIFDNYRDLLTTPATIRVYVSSLTFTVIVWAITLPRAQRGAAHRVLSVVCDPVLDLRDHPHDRVDPVSRPERRLQPDRDGPRPHLQAA